MKKFKVGDLVITRSLYSFTSLDKKLTNAILPKGTVLTIIEIDDSRIEWSSQRIIFLFKDTLCYIMSTQFPLAKQWSGLCHFKTDWENKQ